MEYKLMVIDCFSLQQKITPKEVRLSGVDTVVKPSLLDDHYTFLNKDKHVIYSIPALNVIWIQLINNKKESENE